MLDHGAGGALRYRNLSKNNQSLLYQRITKTVTKFVSFLALAD